MKDARNTQSGIGVNDANVTYPGFWSVDPMKWGSIGNRCPNTGELDYEH